VIIFEEIAEDGTVTYPHREQCTVCGSRGSEAGGRVGRITVDRRDSEERSEEREFTPKLDSTWSDETIAGQGLEIDEAKG
jgi:uncharacterized OB-fold protein